MTDDQALAKAKQIWPFKRIDADTNQEGWVSVVGAIHAVGIRTITIKGQDVKATFITKGWGDSWETAFKGVIGGPL